MVAVRPATVSDLEAVVALRLALLRDAHASPVYGRLRPDAARRARRLFQMQLESEAEVTFLAEQDRMAIGILRCIESHGSPLLEPDTYGYVSSVYVVPEMRRTGILRRLLACAEEWCRARGLDEIRLHSVAGASANEAWDALAFEIVEHLRVRKI